jgi:hypothetical protein
MVGTSRPAAGRKLALLALALVLCVRPVWCAQVTIGSCTLGQLEVPACCVEPEPASCCPADEKSESGPIVVPSCCGVDAPQDEARESEPLPRLSVPDPTRRVLQELTRALHVIHGPCPVSHVPMGAPHAGHAPPGSIRAARPPALHWLTDRGALAALALLSSARL